MQYSGSYQSNFILLTKFTNDHPQPILCLAELCLWKRCDKENIERAILPNMQYSGSYQSNFILLKKFTNDHAQPILCLAELCLWKRCGKENIERAIPPNIIILSYVFICKYIHKAFDYKCFKVVTTKCF